MTCRIPRSRLLVLLAISLVLGGAATLVSAFPSFWSSEGCSSCHNNDSVSCNGCHHHRGSLAASPSQGEYFPGDPVTVTLNGGQQSGWIRALLYDHNNVEVARREGPTGTGDDGLGNPVVFPVQLTATAPAQPGNYVWRAAWFGNTGNGGSAHGEVRVNTTITVVANPADTPGEDSPTRWQRSWGRLKERFGR